MGTKRVWLMDNQPDGTTASGANLLSETGDAAIVSIGAGNSMAFDGTDKFQGSCSLKLTDGGSNTMSARFPFAASCTAGRVSVMRKAASAPPTTHQWMQFVDASNNLLFRIGTNSSGKLFFSTFTGATTVVEARWNRYEVRFNQGSGSGDGALTINAYNGAATGTPDALCSSTTVNLGAGVQVAAVSLYQSTSFAWNQSFDVLQIEDLSPLAVGVLPSEIGPYVPPTVAVGEWRLGSIGMGGTPATYPWTVGSAAKLTYAPPFDPASPPAGTVVLNVSDTARHVDGGGHPVLIVWPNTPVSSIANLNTYESQVTVQNATDVVSIGGEIAIPQTTPSALASAVDGTQTTIPLTDASMFPTQGMVRCQGELIRYTGKTGNTLTGCTRQAGFFNSGTGSSNTTHPSGAAVYISERSRSGLSLANFTGTAHVEGLYVHGFVCDGIRFSGGTGVLHVQRGRVEGVTNYDLVGETDGHPDGIQAYGGGCVEIDIDQFSVILAANGNGFINRGSDSAPSTPVARWKANKFEIVSPNGDARSMYANSDGTTNTAFTFTEAYERAAAGQSVYGSSGTGLDAQFQRVAYAAGQPDTVPASRVGIGYATPGYLP